LYLGGALLLTLNIICHFIIQKEPSHGHIKKLNEFKRLDGKFHPRVRKKINKIKKNNTKQIKKQIRRITFLKKQDSKSTLQGGDQTNCIKEKWRELNL